MRVLSISLTRKVLPFFRFLLTAAAVFVVTFIQIKSLTVVGEKFKARLRMDMFANTLTLDNSYFDKEENSSGALASRLAADTQLVASGYGGGFAVLVRPATTAR